MHPLIRHTSVALVAGALAASALAAPATAATPRETAATGWLAGQLTDGVLHNDAWDFDDYGLTIDAGLAFAQSGGRRAALRQITTRLRTDQAAYISDAAWGDPTAYRAGATAKLASYVDAVGGDPRAFGGTDLITRLEGLVSTSGATAGRLQDKADVDYTNTIAQAFGVRALDGAGSSLTASARRFLLAQQCDRGFFRESLSRPADPDQTCSGAAKADRAPSVDTTALAVITLRGLDRRPKAVRVSIRKAVRWLKTQQADNGSFVGGAAGAGANSNATGLAGWALGVTGACAPARSAAVWIRKRQTVATTGKLAADRGAIAYDAKAKRSGVTDGILATNRHEWQRATAQAAPALRYLDLAACRAGR